MEWTKKKWVVLWTTFSVVAAVLADGTQDVEDIGLISCTAKLSNIDVELRTAEVRELMVECPQSCLDDNYCYVIGSGPYTKTSSVCCASIHSGALKNKEGGRVLVKINHVPVPQFFKSTKNNVTTRSQYLMSTVTFELEEVKTHTMTTQPTTTSIPTTTKQALHLQNMFDLVQSNEDPRKVHEDSIFLTTTTEKTTSRSANYRAPTSVDVAAGHDETIKIEETTKLTQRIQETTNHVVKKSTVIDPFVEKIGLSIGAFIAGAACVLLLVCLRRKKKKMRQRRWGGSKSNSGTQRCDEGNVCVCYQNLNTPKQGLLYDPETCDRPCPIRKSNDDRLVREVKLVSEKKFNKSSKRDIKCEIACEDPKCNQECSGACNPTLYDF